MGGVIYGLLPCLTNRFFRVSMCNHIGHANETKWSGLQALWFGLAIEAHVQKCTPVVNSIGTYDNPDSKAI